MKLKFWEKEPESDLIHLDRFEHCQALNGIARSIDRQTQANVALFYTPVKSWIEISCLLLITGIVVYILIKQHLWKS